MSEEEKQPEKEVFSKEKLIQGFKDGKFKNIVVMTGAGISVSAGIPDFRSADTGLYANLQKYNLPTPESIFDIDYFRESPEAFYGLASTFLDLSKHKPTPTHWFCKMLKDKGIMGKYLTQNIDNLEGGCGWAQADLVQAHGANFGATCSKCGKPADRKKLEEGITAGTIYRCDKEDCGGPVKPDITFFGEGLPPCFFQAMQHIQEHGADLLIVIGTALAVGPFNQIVNMISDTTPKALINMENTDYSGFEFDDQERYPNRILLKGKCDEVVHDICTQVGWIKDLEELMGKEFKIDAAAGVDTADLASKLSGLDINKKTEETKKDMVATAKIGEVMKGDPKDEKTEYGIAPGGDGAQIIEDGAQIVEDRAPEVDAKDGDIMGFHAVQPIKECPHCVPGVNIAPIEEFKDLTVTTPCKDCGHTQENWVCLKCKVICCSRYVKQHMVQHNESSGHPIALSFADFSFWCYECDNYVVSKHLNHVKHFYPQKFSEDMSVVDQYQIAMGSKAE